MKTNFGLKNMCKNIQEAKAGKLNMLHFSTEFSNYPVLSKEKTSKKEGEK